MILIGERGRSKGNLNCRKFTSAIFIFFKTKNFIGEIKQNSIKIISVIHNHKETVGVILREPPFVE